MGQPLFSIGVTTYKRPELLRETLASIRRQTFTDYEVLVGNDDTDDSLSGDRLGIEDPRVRFINHPRNLGEMKNMKALLEAARGRYFTWLADDDLYAREFLERVHGALVGFSFPPCVFTSYRMGARYSDECEKRFGTGERLLSGREFLREYLARSLNILGCYGMFEIGCLIRNGGMEQLGDGFSPYSDALLAIKSGLLERIVYIDEPLIFFRSHEGSISWTSPDLGAYRTAQESFLKKSLAILASAGLRDDLHRNMTGLLKWCIGDFAFVARRAGCLTANDAIGYARFVRRYVVLLKGSEFYWAMVGRVLLTTLALACHVARVGFGFRAGRRGAGTATMPAKDEISGDPADAPRGGARA